ncbi:hypothetical protein ACFQ0D_29680, partial [Micromonospora zhanjiangensis]
VGPALVGAIAGAAGLRTALVTMAGLALVLAAASPLTTRIRPHTETARPLGPTGPDIDEDARQALPSINN